jgi:hypothetical protein
MRKMSIIMGCIAVFALAGAGSAAVEFRFSRPDTGFDEFRHDQLLCQQTATSVDWRRGHWGAPSRANAFVGNASGAGMRIRHSAPEFLRCMTYKGYRPDANGYSTGRLKLKI